MCVCLYIYTHNLLNCPKKFYQSARVTSKLSEFFSMSYNWDPWDEFFHLTLWPPWMSTFSRRSGLRLKCRLLLLSSLKCIWYIFRNLDKWLVSCFLVAMKDGYPPLPSYTFLWKLQSYAFQRFYHVRMTQEEINPLLFSIPRGVKHIYCLYVASYFALAFLCPVSMIKCINSPPIIMTTIAWMFNWRHNEEKRGMELFQMKAPLRKHGSCNKA